MKLRNIRIKALYAATPDGIQTAVNDWLYPPDIATATRTEEQFVDISFGSSDFFTESDGGPFYCFITYLES